MIFAGNPKKGIKIKINPYDLILEKIFMAFQVMTYLLKIIYKNIEKLLIKLAKKFNLFFYLQI